MSQGEVEGVGSIHADPGQLRSGQEILTNGSGDTDIASLQASPKSETSPNIRESETVDVDIVETAGMNRDTTDETLADRGPDSSPADSVSEQDLDVASNTESRQSETDRDAPPSDETHQPEAADAENVKESDVTDECLKEEQEEEDGWLDIFGSGQLKKKVITAGKDGSRPQQGSLITVKIKGYVEGEDGTCIQDSTETFILGDGDVIPGLDMCVALMNHGEVAQVTTASRFAYGTKGRSPDIPGDASLRYELELLDVQPGPDVDKLSVEERLKFAEQKRLRGNELFGREDYSAAINSYSKAVQFTERTGAGLSGETSLLQQLLDCKNKCYNNMAASQLKVGAADAAIRSCEEVLQTQPDNIKALYRLGKAYSAKGQLQKAMVPLKKALKLDPESKLLHRELAWLSKQQKREAESEKSMYKRMLGNVADAASKAKGKKSSNSILRWTLVAGGLGVAALSVGLAYYRFGH